MKLKYLLKFFISNNNIVKTDTAGKLMERVH